MGQAAYDYNTARRRKAPQTQRKTALRVEKGGKRRLSPLQAALRNAMHLVAAALLTGFAISLLMSEAQLVELNDQIQDAKAQLVSAQSQYTYYNSTLNSMQRSPLGVILCEPSGSDHICFAVHAFCPVFDQMLFHKRRSDTSYGYKTQYGETDPCQNEFLVKSAFHMFLTSNL